MRHLIILVVMLCFSYRCLSQTKTEDTLQNYNCSDKWEYFNLKKTITAQVVAHLKSGPCGNIAFASITIIKLNNDTIRVLELCDNEKEFEYKQSVVITPIKKPNFGVALPVIVGYHCKNFKTSYGIVTLKK